MPSSKPFVDPETLAAVTAAAAASEAAKADALKMQRVRSLSPGIVRTLSTAGHGLLSWLCLPACRMLLLLLLQFLHLAPHSAARTMQHETLRSKCSRSDVVEANSEDARCGEQWRCN